MAAAEIYLVRHAQSVWNAALRWQGQADPPLSPHGVEQATTLAAHFPARPVTHVFASDLQRAIDTATPLAARFGVDIAIDADLRELDVGSWSGLTRNQIAERFPGALDLFFQGREGWEDGESYAEHAARADAFARRMHDLPDGSVVVAVTHGGTLRAIVLALLEIDHDLRWRFTGIHHTSVTHVTLGPFGYRLEAYNSVLEIEQV